MAIQNETGIKYKGPTFLQDSEPSSPTEGDTWVDSDGTTRVYFNGSWTYVKIAGTPGDIGIIPLGYDYFNALNNIDQITISSPGNATNFGDLTVKRASSIGISNGVDDNGVICGGGTPGSGGSENNVMDQVTISSPGNATDFGDLLVDTYRGGAVSNGTNDTGLIIGGAGNDIQKITISSPGNATDFGYSSEYSENTALSNGVKDTALYFYWYDNTIWNLTITTPGNSTDFGDLSSYGNGEGYATFSNDVNDRGIIAGGLEVPRNVIHYITITSPGNSTDFGNLLSNDSWYKCSGCSNGTGDIGIITGQYDMGSPTDRINYITISSPSNASDFGNLTQDASWIYDSSISNGAL